MHGVLPSSVLGIVRGGTFDGMNGARAASEPVLSRRRDVDFHWSLWPGARGGLTGVRVRLDSRGVIERAVATGRFWLFAAVLSESGTTEAALATGWTRLPARRAFFVPPRSLIRLRLSDVALEAVGLVGTAPLASDRLVVPCVAELPAGASAPVDLEGIRASLVNAVRLDPDGGVSPFAVQTRGQLLDRVASPRAVADSARAMGVAPDTLSRRFHEAYGIGPKSYILSVRVSDAALALLAGRRILAAAFEAGFRDTARFYRNFARKTGTTPGRYASLHDRKTPRHGVRGG
jgi:AraC-like DNA-binding protein